MNNLLMLDIAPGPLSGNLILVAGIVLGVVAVLALSFVFLRKRRKRRFTDS